MKEQIALVEFENVQKLGLSMMAKLSRGSRRALPTHVQDRDHDHFVADDLKGNRERKPTRKHAPQAFKVICVQQRVVR